MIQTSSLLTDVRSYLKTAHRLNFDGMLDNQLRRRVAAFLERSQIAESDLLTTLRRDREAAERFADSMTINVTAVLRNRASWELLEGSYLPGLGRSIKVWSAGCSYGAEPYSLGIVTDRIGIRAQIVATDIDKKALASAAKATFSAYDLREVEASIKDKYFDHKPEGYVVAKDIQNRVTFKQQNLLTDRAPIGGPFDLITCRNTIIYFDEDSKNRLFAEFSRVLKPNGVIFVGAAERISNASQVGLEMVEPQFYVKR